MIKFKNIFYNVFLASIIFLSGCSEEEKTAEQNIIGKWTTTEFKAGILVDGVLITDWYSGKYQSSEAEATEFANQVLDDIGNNLTGTMEFMADRSYKINFGDEPEVTGVWQLVEENQKVQFTNSINNESNESDIKALNSSLLILGFTDTSRGDIDNAPGNEDLFISVELTLEK